MSGCGTLLAPPGYNGLVGAGINGKSSCLRCQSPSSDGRGWLSRLVSSKAPVMEGSVPELQVITVLGKIEADNLTDLVVCESLRHPGWAGVGGKPPCPPPLVGLG